MHLQLVSVLSSLDDQERIYVHPNFQIDTYFEDIVLKRTNNPIGCVEIKHSPGQYKENIY